MKIETDEPVREMHRMSESSWRAVMQRVSGEKLRGNPASRSRVMMTWVGSGILMYTYHHLCLNPGFRFAFCSAVLISSSGHVT